MTSAALRDGLDLEVVEVVPQPGEVRTIVLADVTGGRLPAYPPGSHLVIDCDLTANAYSLTGSGESPQTYAVSVLHDLGGRGGSRWMHRLQVGDRVRASRPRAAFGTVAIARRHLLIAAGIGVTPILSHARAAARWNRPAVVMYVHRPGADVHADDLREIAAGSPTVDVQEYLNRASFREALSTELLTSPLGTHLYVCGPEPFMDEVRGRAAEAGWPQARIHAEAFGAAQLDPGAPFTAVLSSTAERVPVPSGVSLLEALAAAGREIPNLCLQGFCGECRVGVSGGNPLHRDHFLTPEEKRANDVIMPCVSRCQGDELELSL